MVLVFLVVMDNQEFVFHFYIDNIDKLTKVYLMIK